MADSKGPLFADAKDQFARLGADLGQMANLRWQLAVLELRAAVSSVKRLAIGLVAVVVMVSVALSILAVGAAQFLPDATRAYWLLISGFGLLTVAALTGWLVRRRFQRLSRRFFGLEQTLEELREDIVWLREWAGSGEEEGTRDQGSGASG